jgi:hypothetical protein
MKSKLIWAAVGGLLVLGAWMLFSALQVKADPPILVGDGSMVIESGMPLAQWDWNSSTPRVITHPNQGKKIHMVKHKGGTAFKDCKGAGGCTVMATWKSGLSVFTMELSENGGNHEVTINSSVPFNDPQWNKTFTYTWICQPDPSMTLDEIKVKQDQSDWTSLCKNKGCKVEIEYK